MAAVAQTPPAGQNKIDWMRGSHPVAVQSQVAPRLVCELCTAAAPQAEKQGGANPAAIRRAIRALGSRIFPGKKLTTSPGMNVRPAGFQAPDKR